MTSSCDADVVEDQRIPVEPVNLKTIVKRIDEHDLKVAKRRNREPEPEEQGMLIRYDGSGFEEQPLSWEEVEDIAADDVDYDTKPEEWLA